ncbi:MAG TPA: PD-(D/E)XK motif protein [Bacteroidales bacterium]|nr:PD-(D/E)XK motif protein [Bacteroidales bacterium]
MQLEESSSVIPGLFKLRYSETSNCDVFLGVKYPETHRMLIVRVPFASGKEFNFKYEFRGLKFDKIYDPENSGFLLLNLVLVDNQFKDVFDSLIADILAAIINESDFKVILRNYSNRLIKWQSLFERFRQQGLTPEEQRGLYGELYFMRKFLLVNSDFNNIVISWIGPEKLVRDFQFGNWSVEVKTTHGNNHQKVQISSERQLDTANVDNLFLNHLSLESVQHSGETLNQMIDSIYEILNIDLTALNQFRNKLTDAGFFDPHRQYYSDIGYFIRQDIFYKVEHQFPRIEESDIRNGVGDVKYSIIVSQCNDFIISDQEIFKTLIFL